jgi:probable phosphoglycerate mutase
MQVEKQVLCVRHAESLENAAERPQNEDGSLSERGIEQARITAGRLAHFRIDTIITSPWQRARETADIFAERLEVPVAELDAARERRHPSEVVGKHKYDPQAQEVSAAIWRNFTEPNYRYSDEENFEDLRERSGQVERALLNASGERIALVSHGAFLRALFAYMLHPGVSAHEVYDFFCRVALMNASITALNYTEEYGWRLQFLNSCCHLERELEQ